MAGSVGAANNYGPMGPDFGRNARHGSSEQGYGGLFGITPPGTPPATRQTTPTRLRSGFMRQPNDDRSGSRARQISRDREPSTMPSEWGGRTLRTERMIEEINRQLQNVMTTMTAMGTRLETESGKLTALERALPERLHKIEERQANHVELLNQISQFFTTQLETMNNRMSAVENSRSPKADTPGFGTSPPNFDIGSPPPGQGNPFEFGKSPPPSPAATPTTHGGAPPDPWAQRSAGSQDPWSGRSAPNVRQTPPHNPGAHNVY